MAATNRLPHNGHSTSAKAPRPARKTAPKRKSTRSRKSTRRSPTPPPRSPRVSLAERFAHTLGYVNAVRALAKQYLFDQAEQVKERSREAMHTAVNRLLGGAVVVTILVMIVVLTINGVAGAFAELFGGRAWAGDLVTAGILALGLGISWLSLQLFADQPSRRPGRHSSSRSPAVAT